MADSKSTYFAHSLENRPPEKWETMAEHESHVATLCRNFLSRINPSLAPWGELLGRWHGWAKSSKKFEVYLHAAKRTFDQLGDASEVDYVWNVGHSKTTLDS